MEIRSLVLKFGELHKREKEREKDEGVFGSTEAFKESLYSHNSASALFEHTLTQTWAKTPPSRDICRALINTAGVTSVTQTLNRSNNIYDAMKPFVSLMHLQKLWFNFNTPQLVCCGFYSSLMVYFLFTKWLMKSYCGCKKRLVTL